MSLAGITSSFNNLHRRIGIAGVVALVSLGILAVIWSVHMAPAWLNNPDLSHGLFTPILFGLLIRESIYHGSPRFLPDRPRTLATLLVFILGLSLLILATGSLYAVATEWGHPLVQFFLGISLTGAVVGGWIFCASNSVKLVPINWISAVAVGLWVLSLPLPPGSYNQLTLSLQFRVTENVLSALHVLGIPAIRNGNIINLAHATVGVEEACSGVRSLISCIYAGFFFSAAFVRSWPSRILLIGIAPVLAVMMNFVRSLSLTLMANANIDIEGTWHDWTGFGILLITALILAGIAIVLEKIETRPDSGMHRTELVGSRFSPGPETRHLATILSCACAFGLLWIIAFQTMTRTSPSPDLKAPALAQWLPSNPTGWQVAPEQDLYRFSDILETRDLVQRTYGRLDENGKPINITVYLAYWKPGQSSVSLVASHTPDACWPGAGWVAQPTAYRTVQLPVGTRTTEPAEYRVFSFNESPRHVWFWHSYNRRIIEELNPRRPLELITSVLRYGVRSEGDQLFVRISSNREWNEIRDDPLIPQIFSKLQPYGI